MKKKFVITIGCFALFACQADNKMTNEQTLSATKTSILHNKAVITSANTEQLKVNHAEITPKDKKSVLTFQGTIHFYNLEGGFYGIVTNEGQKLLPMNLDKSFHQPGAVVKVSGEYVDIMTIQQWGAPFKIKHIELIKAGTGDNNKADY